MARQIAERYRCCPADSDDITLYHSLVKYEKLKECLKAPDAAPHGDNIDWYSVFDYMFEKHYRTPDERRSLIDEFISGTERSGAERAINWAHLCIGELVRHRYVSTVLTTNFDGLVLSGLVRAGVLPVVCDGIESLHRIAGSPRDPQLVELHGSRHAYIVRVSPADVRKLRDDLRTSNALMELFKQAITFVAIGYGGREAGVMDLLIRVVHEHPGKYLFWTSYTRKPDEVSPKVLAFLSATSSDNGALLLGQDADRFFLKLAEELAIGPPSAISKPLDLLAELISAVSKSKSTDVDINSEIAESKALLSRLQSFGARSDDSILTFASAVRDARLRGDYGRAYEVANGAIAKIDTIQEVDHRLLKEAALAALEYGRTLDRA